MPPKISFAQNEYMMIITIGIMKNAENHPPIGHEYAGPGFGFLHPFSDLLFLLKLTIWLTLFPVIC